MVSPKPTSLEIWAQSPLPHFTQLISVKLPYCGESSYPPWTVRRFNATVVPCPDHVREVVRLSGVWVCLYLYTSVYLLIYKLDATTSDSCPAMLWPLLFVWNTVL